MLKTVRTAFFYIRYYKKQTLALALGIIMSVGLLTGISSLIYSGRAADTERCRSLYGDAHYSLSLKPDQLAEWKTHRQGKGYTLEKAGTLLIKKQVTEPYNITFAYGDPSYMQMFGRTLVSGTYPKKAEEAALDKKAIQNLELKGKPGERFTVKGEEFTLCGVLADKWDTKKSDLEIFVARDRMLDKEKNLLFLKFDESRRVYPQLQAFQTALHYKADQPEQYCPLSTYTGGYARESVIHIIKEGMSLPEGQIVYIWARLNDEYALTAKLISAVLGIFSAFVIFSLFQISLRKRTSQYGVMQVLGMDEKGTFGLLISELFTVFAFGYPIGAILGNGAAGVFYSHMGEMFVDQRIGERQGGVHSSDIRDIASAVEVKAGSFHISWAAAVWGAVFLMLLLILISALLVRHMRVHTWADMISENTEKKKKSRRIYSLKRANMTGVVSRKFIFEKKAGFVTMILSLSLGCILFLGTTYVAQNTRIHNELAFKADDGLGSDIQAYEDSHQLSDVIPKKTAFQIADLEGVRQVNPVAYTMGEIPLEEGTYNWKDYYPEVASDRSESFQPDPVCMERYNGIITQQAEDSYRLKTNVYGYSDHMLDSLQDYLLEGSLSPKALDQENTVVLKTIMDGQGNYDGIDIKPGDTIRLKVPKSQQVPEEALRFQGPEDWYVEKEFKVCALVSRSLGKTKDYLNAADNHSDSGIVSIIMTNRQMEQNFGIQGYNNLSIILSDGADETAVSNQVRQAVSGIPKCLTADYTKLIRKQEQYLSQKLFFFYGIAAILLIISAFHMLNSMQYLVTSRKREFGILRAMGITDAGFCRMLAREGLCYGLWAAGLTAVLYGAVQKIMYYAVQHVFLYLHPLPALSPIFIGLMALVNILICISAMLWAGREVLKDSIINEIRV